MDQPGGSTDPTWSLDRYVNPRDPSAGWFGLKPGHPERVLFALIGGVPLPVPTDANGVAWDALLGAESPGGPDDFANRDSSLSAMRQANPDSNCGQRVVPACFREGSSGSATACTADLRYFAWPARRLAEIARRFDRSTVCGGAACENGFVSSICALDYSPALAQFAARISARAAGQ